jgi:hypothetical protein
MMTSRVVDTEIVERWSQYVDFDALASGSDALSSTA